MRRYALRDDQWDRIKELLPGREGHVGVTARDNRLFVKAVLYRYRAGIPWRDLPERFGDPVVWIKIPAKLFVRYSLHRLCNCMLQRQPQRRQFRVIGVLGDRLSFSIFFHVVPDQFGKILQIPPAIGGMPGGNEIMRDQGFRRIRKQHRPHRHNFKIAQRSRSASASQR